MVCSAVHCVLPVLALPLRSRFNLADVPPGRPSAVTWEKFLQDTGPRAYTRDMGRAFLLSRGAVAALH